MKLFTFIPKKKKYTLVISWWGTRWFYALGILKWLEQLGYKDRIQAIYGVSAWALVGSYRAAWYTAEQIYDMFFWINPFGLSSINIFSKESLLRLNYFEKKFSKDLPQQMKDLLNKFQEHQKVKNIFDTLSISFEILLRHHTIENMWEVKHLFYKDLPLKVLDISKKKMHKAYLEGYKDCMEHFKN